MSKATIGPVRRGSVAVARLDEAIAAYRQGLDLELVGRHAFDAARARAWGRPELAGLPSAQLGADRGDAGTHWLELIEVPGWEPVPPFGQGGWLALEVLVADVLSLAGRLATSPFRILGEPRPLALSEQIRAMQVAGPSGEVLYLTEVKAAVPPFDLPLPARRTAERLFIPVVAVPDRDAALAAYEHLCGTQGLRFDTRVAALQRALRQHPDTLRAVATLPLAGQCLVEIDAVPELFGANATPGAILAVRVMSAAGRCSQARAPEVWFGPGGECLEIEHVTP